MAAPGQAIQDWYTEQLEKYHAQKYLAYARGKEKEDSANELGRSAVFVPRKEHKQLPAEVRDAHKFYWDHFEATDLGSARLYRFRVRKKTIYAVLVTTDGDDGYAEFYDENGNYLNATRRYIEIMAWGTRDWLRAQASSPSDLPPELKDAHLRTLWGQPIKGIHCGVTCKHNCTAKPRGACNEKLGHIAKTGSPHCCSRCGFTWGGKAKPPEPPAPTISPWLAESHNLEGDYFEERLLITEVTIDTDQGPVKVPVADILQIDFAPRQEDGSLKKSKVRDIISMADAVYTGIIPGAFWENQFPGYTTQRHFCYTSRIVKRFNLEDAAGKIGTRREFRLRGRTDGVLCGTNLYTLNSCVATAAVHAGILKEGHAGTVRVEVVASPPRFEGTTRHGITSDAWDEPFEDGAYRFY